jgi:hypothetical protein
MLPTGLVSVMPQPWMTSTPRERKASSMLRVGAAPPVVATLRDGTLLPDSCQYVRSPRWTVGTPM